jgi:hypothetical protein
VAGLFASTRTTPAPPTPPRGTGPEQEFGFGGPREEPREERRSRDDRDRGRDRDDREEDDYDDRSSRRSRRSGGGGFGEILAFRKMVGPLIVMVLFWILVAGSCLMGLFQIYIGVRLMSLSAMGGLLTLFGGLLSIPLGILAARLYCELMIVLFRIYERLVEVKAILEKRDPS